MKTNPLFLAADLSFTDLVVSSFHTPWHILACTADSCSEAYCSLAHAVSLLSGRFLDVRPAVSCCFAAVFLLWPLVSLLLCPADLSFLDLIVSSFHTPWHIVAFTAGSCSEARCSLAHPLPLVLWPFSRCSPCCVCCFRAVFLLSLLLQPLL